MPVYQQLLTITSEIADTPVSELIKTIRKEILANQSVQGVVALIPDGYVLPKSISDEKSKTKWEKFAEEKGIRKKKRSRMVFSEKYDRWVPRYGSRSEQNLMLQGGVVEVEQSMSKMLNEKKARVAKNTRNRVKNQRK